MKSDIVELLASLLKSMVMENAAVCQWPLPVKIDGKESKQADLKTGKGFPIKRSQVFIKFASLEILYPPQW